MPVRSLKQSVWHWPAPDQVLNDVRVWAQQQKRRSPSLEHVGVFGSYGRGTAAFGSDLDLILVDAGASEGKSSPCSNGQRDLPLSCDALVSPLLNWA